MWWIDKSRWRREFLLWIEKKCIVWKETNESEKIIEFVEWSVKNVEWVISNEKNLSRKKLNKLIIKW